MSSNTGLFDVEKDPYREPTDFIRQVYLNTTPFMVMKTSAYEWSCSFYSLGVSRSQAANLLLRNTDNEFVRKCIGEQIYAAVVRDDREQLPEDQTPFDPIKKLIEERSKIQTQIDELTREIFDYIEKHTEGLRPRNFQEALTRRKEIKDEKYAGKLKILEKKQGSIDVKKGDIQELCEQQKIIEVYIRDFIVQPHKTMEFQHDEGKIIHYSALDAIAYITKQSLRLYQPLEGAPGQMILRHTFDHPKSTEIKHIIHTGGNKGAVGHFSRLDPVPSK